MRNNEQGELPYPVVCSSLELKHVVGVRGGGGREISSDPGQLWGLSWSGGLHLSAPGGLSLSSFCLSLSVQLDMQELRNPPPPRSRPALPGHAWPSLGIHSGCFLFTACTLLYLSQQALPSTVSTCLCFFSNQPSLNPFYLLTLFIFKLLFPTFYTL